VEPPSPLTVRTGRFTHQDVLVTSRAANRHALATAGDLLAAVADSAGSVVGVHVGPHNAARVELWIEPHQISPLPVLIGTASVVPDLGYAVPLGQWHLVIALHTNNGVMLSAPLEITITP
jgi:hypothetical protein